MFFSLYRQELYFFGIFIVEFLYLDEAVWGMMLRKKINISFDQFPNHYPTKIESLVASMNWEAIRRKQKIYLIEDWFLIVGFLIGIVGALAAAIVSL